VCLATNILPGAEGFYADARTASSEAGRIIEVRHLGGIEQAPRRLRPTARSPYRILTPPNALDTGVAICNRSRKVSLSRTSGSAQATSVKYEKGRRHGPYASPHSYETETAIQ
jgi:hypothetical protein